ncbi:hypothetical protein GCM10010406_24520 [Streptomyces thermolineatus]|uniref:Uncharacterized protein n=1 Tax=Streptomyces thermolineatus TaxID=44033 RepID=A0ABP5Z2G0_9ACTN
MSDRNTNDAAGGRARHERSEAPAPQRRPGDDGRPHPHPYADPHAASMEELLASCAAANAVSTPPDAPDDTHRAA